MNRFPIVWDGDHKQWVVQVDEDFYAFPTLLEAEQFVIAESERRESEQDGAA